MSDSAVIMPAFIENLRSVLQGDEFTIIRFKSRVAYLHTYSHVRRVESSFIDSIFEKFLKICLKLYIN